MCVCREAHRDAISLRPCLHVHQCRRWAPVWSGVAVLRGSLPLPRLAPLPRPRSATRSSTPPRARTGATCTARRCASRCEADPCRWCARRSMDGTSARHPSSPCLRTGFRRARKQTWGCGLRAASCCAPGLWPRRRRRAAVWTGSGSEGWTAPGTRLHLRHVRARMLVRHGSRIVALKYCHTENCGSQTNMYAHCLRVMKAAAQASRGSGAAQRASNVGVQCWESEVQVQLQQYKTGTTQRGCARVRREGVLRGSWVSQGSQRARRGANSARLCRGRRRHAGVPDAASCCRAKSATRGTTRAEVWGCSQVAAT